MVQVCVLLSAALLAFCVIWFADITRKKKGADEEKTKNNKSTALKVLSVVLVAVYACRLFTVDVIRDVIGLVPTEQLSGFSPAALALMTVLRMLTNVAVIAAMMAPWYKISFAKNLASLYVPFVYLLNVVFFTANVQTFVGQDAASGFTWRALQFGAECALALAISAVFLYDKIRKRDFDKKQILTMLGVLLPMIMAVLPLEALRTLFGTPDIVADDFSLTHRIVIYITFIVPALLYLLLKDREYGVRDFALTYIAVCGFVTYYSLVGTNFTVSNVPLHLCHTAIILMLLSFVFKSKKLFYFNYFVNVLGALVAVIIPDEAGNFFNPSTMQFWYNHIYAVFLPILGVALKIFPRPNIKMMRNSIVVFSVYFVFAALINTWFANYDPNVDYFFLRQDHILEFFTFAYPLKYQFTYVWQVGNLTFTFYPLYWLGVWVGFILLMFLEWLVYAALFRVFDDWGLLYRKKRMLKMDMLGLKKEMDGRPLSEPLHPEGANMIKISHFSKKYGGSDRFAVKDFNLEVYDGEVFGFIGHNGAGKSTTIKSLVGIQSITEGTMEICGYDIEKQPLQAKLNIGYVSDNHAVYEKLTGREYINYVADLYLVSKEDRTRRMEKYVGMFGLENSIDNEIKSYSHGMKQKIVVIAALIHNPKVWVLDEPLTGLDPTSAYQIKECMKEHAKAGNIVFFSSHVIEVVEKICDRIAIISHGELKGVYDVKELTASGKSVEELYLGFAAGGAGIKGAVANV